MTRFGLYHGDDDEDLPPRAPNYPDSDRKAAEKFGNELIRKVGSRERAVAFAAYLTHFLACEAEGPASPKQDDYTGFGGPGACDPCECGGSMYTEHVSGLGTQVVHLGSSCTYFKHRFRDAYGTLARDQVGWKNSGSNPTEPKPSEKSGNDTSTRALLLEL